MTHLKLTDEQRRQIKELTDKAVAGLGKSIADYIDNEVLATMGHETPQVETAPVAENPVPSVTNFDPVPMPTFEPNPAPNPGADIPTPAPTPIVPEVLASAPANFSVPPTDFAPPANEIAPPPAPTESVFGDASVQPSFNNLDGNDLNYAPMTPPVNDIASIGDDGFESLSAPMPNELPDAPSAQFAPVPATSPAATPELDLPAPFSDPSTPSSPPEASQNGPVVSPPAPVEPAPANNEPFSKGHSLLSKVMSKGWGKKKQ